MLRVRSKAASYSYLRAEASLQKFRRLSLTVNVDKKREWQQYQQEWKSMSRGVAVDDWFGGSSDGGSNSRGG